MPKRTKKKKPKYYTKAWERKGKPSDYHIDSKEVNITILVVCEGQTEKLYFESFPVLTLTVEIRDLGGQSKLKLIKETDRIIENSDKDFDLIWCVFDMDVKKGGNEFSDFDNAIKSGQKKGFNVGYSNDCFEVWFYLHYNFTQQQNHRHFYYKFLSDQWGCNYEKDGKKYNFCQAIYAILEDDDEASQESAIRNAKKLYDRQSDIIFHDQNPVTKVYELVELLNKNLRR